MKEKRIYMYNNGIITLHVRDENREKAWVTLTNVGATVTECHKWQDGSIFATGDMPGDLIQIEVLERAGWEM